MCGLAGYADLSGRPADLALLARMTAVLAHRGPDGEGLHLEGPVGLGHRRLAIIDLATGTQPMASADGRLWIAFNGEIYNFRELRSELERRGGWFFRTSSDTEVILAAYDAWGTACLRRLRGMFAFALWDAPQRRLLLARDRVGIKPLVYARLGDRFLFASEIKAILEDRTVPHDLDWEALGEYLTLGYVSAPRTIFRAIRKLPPASYLLLDPDSGRQSVHRYWDLQFRPDTRRSADEWMEGLRHHLVDAVESHLVADVPVGAFLSGGMDSSTVVALMARTQDRPVRTFSIGFDHADFDELAWAREVARRYSTDHYEMVVKPDAMEALPRLVWQFDEPFADSSALPTYYVAKITREHVTVALSGDGGDENFAGYRRYARAAALHRTLDVGPGRSIRPLLAVASRLLPRGVRGQGYLDLLGAPALERYFRMVALQTRAGLDALLGPEARRHLPAAPDGTRFQRMVAAAHVDDFVSALQYVDVHTYLPEDILTKVDRTSMLVALEARVPLLDHVLMEYLATMPSSLKLRDGQGKYILKRVMAQALPAGVLERPKMGFGVPLGAWFRGEVRDYARDVLLSRRTAERGLLNPLEVHRLLAEHAAGRDRSALIWALLCLEEWARRWLD
ncbi:MAG TPA: asparagine synthase (glutamine-hydrolyzing) [Dehalococcoidia bacterium]|nr:asparagine synthase (glutamine-hydrolyzing) [Dehalococcoidia bacterium]